MRSVSRRRFLGELAWASGGTLVALAAPAGAEPRGGSRTVVLGRPMLGTVVEAEAHHPDLARARTALGDGFDRIMDVDRLMSVHRADSELSDLARRAGLGSVQVSDDTRRVLAEATWIGGVSRGALDVTILPLVRLWTSSADQDRLPTSAEIDRALALVDLTQLDLNEGRGIGGLRLPGAGVDLGGIAKGYAVDAAVGALGARGVEGGIVNAGGDLRVTGHPEGGGPWRIGVRHPLRPSTLLLSLAIDGEGVATSGNYFRFFTIKDRQYGHVLHPRTGVPADGALAATIVAPTAMRADGLATAALVSGVPAGLELMARASVDGFVVDERSPGKVVVHATRALRDRITLLDPTAAIDA